jgi:hypothetical protein
MDDLGPLGALIALMLPALIMPVYYLAFYTIQSINVIQILLFMFLMTFGGMVVSIVAYFLMGKHV